MQAETEIRRIMQGTKNLTEGPIRRQLFNLALPIMGTSFIQMAYSITDMAWVGRIGSEAVAAVASQVASECYGVVEMVSRRFSDNIATLWGRNKLGKGVKVATVDNLVYIEVFVILKVGVNFSAQQRNIEHWLVEPFSV